MLTHPPLADLPDHDPTQTIGREAYTNYGKIREAGLSDPCAFGSGFRLLAGLPATLEGLAASNKRKGPDPPGDSMAGTATETTDPAVGTMTSDTADLSLVPMGYKHADKSVTTLARTLAEDSADTTDGTVGRLTSKAADAGKEDVKRMTSEQVSHAVDGWVCSMDDLRSKVSSGNCSSLPSIIRTATQGFGPGYVDAEEKYGEILENARITYPDGTQMFNAPQAFSRVAAESVCPRSEVEIAAREEEEAAREEQAAREERRARRREEAEAQSTQGSVMEIEDTPALSKDEETIHGAQPDNDTATPDSTSGHANIGDLSINDGEDDAAQSTGAEAVTPVPVNDDQSAFDGKSEIDNKTSGGAPVLA